jgi:hypothetical protein
MSRVRAAQYVEVREQETLCSRVAAPSRFHVRSNSVLTDSVARALKHLGPRTS